MFGLVWIFLSDWLTGRLGLNTEQLQTVQTVKGSVFVLASVALVYVVTFFEGRKTDMARAEAERAYRLLEEALGISNAAAFMFDRSASLFELSAGVRRMLGLGQAHARIDWSGWLDRIHKDDRQAFDDAVSASLDHGAPLDISLRVLHEDGAYRWIRVQGGVVAGTDGTPTHLTGTLTDITEIRYANDKATSTASLVRALARTNHATVIARSEAELFRLVCEALVDEDAYSLAWVALTGHDDESVSVATAIGDGTVPETALHTGRVQLGDDGDPIRLAMTLGEPVHRDDAWAEPVLSPWRHGSDDGKVGCLIVPFGENGAVAGVLTVFGDLPSDFDANSLLVLSNVGEDIGFALANLRRREQLSRTELERDEANRTLADNLLGAVKALALTVEMRDPYTAGHQERVAELATAIARELGLDEDEINDIRLGAMIHDIGKIYVPAEILTRPGKLSREEFEMIKPHSAKGAEVLEHVGLSPTVKDVVLHHHERLDGTGYPEGLSGDAVSRAARIVAVADVIEAMAAHRPYRPALGLDTTLRHIREARGNTLDADVVDAACRLIEEKGFRFPEAFAPKQ